MLAESHQDFPVSNKRALEFLQKDYELKIGYVSDHFERMWTRFNFFLVLESAVAGGFFTRAFQASPISVCLIGVASSLCWYVLGAQDRYLGELYRRQAESVGKRIAEELNLGEFLRSTYVPVGDVNDKSNAIPHRIYQWRCGPISSTKLIAWLPLLVTAFWLIEVCVLIGQRVMHLVGQS